MALRTGSSGSDVRALQTRLEELGFSPGPIDGQFGPGTESAVRAFQQSRGLTVDGIVGPATAKALGLELERPDVGVEAEIPSGFTGVTVTAVSKMFPSTPVRNIQTHLPNVLGALVDSALADQKMVLMALGSIRAETEGFEPISEFQSKFNTSPEGHPFDKYDDREDLGNQGRPDGERFRGRGFIQLTGRFNYQEHGEAIELGNRLIEEPELANDSEIASKLLASFIKGKEDRIRQALEDNDLRKAC